MAGYIGSRASVVSSGAERKKTFAITTTTTALTGLVYTPTKVHVFHNGVRLVDGTDFTATNSTSITLTVAAESGDQVVVVSYASFQTSDTVSASAGGTFQGNVTVAGAFTSQGIDDNATSTAMTLDSSGNVGIGTTSPSSYYSKDLVIAAPDEGGVTIVSGTTNTAYLMFADGTTGADRYRGQLAYDHNVNEMSFATDGSEAMRIDSSGTVGIGCVPNSIQSGFDTLQIGGNLTLNVDSTGAGAGVYMGNNVYRDSTNSRWEYINTDEASQYYQANGTHVWRYAASGSANAAISWSEAMRIDSSGNLLLGTTGTNWATTAGLYAFNQSALNVTRSGAESMNLNRLSSDGDIIKLYKSGSAVGSIGANGNSGVYIAAPTSGGAALIFNDNAPILYPAKNNSGTIAVADNVIDLGASGVRFDDIYATNGTIQTSDRNEKQDVAALTATEMLVAARISGLFKTFRWIDSVADKGDDARTHTGVIAQDVHASFLAEGLDAGDYALFTSTTWWETQTDVPAVEADEDNEIEAADAYTRTDTFDTLDEAPDGATERTRMGIRYPELLAFVGSYNEQRFASIETRLAALEGN